ncbi:MAG TPA: post-COAP-1 domain-containing protein [Candidatus Limnocylindrales bacterium]|nr:post-COAP-1 domain-containing protein [Candidatus Limnocylindrales bacterium]
MHFRQNPKRFAAILVASVLWLVAAIPVAAVDTLIPSPVVVTLDAGASTTVNKTLSLDGLPARADIIVAIDTTFSMNGPIAQAQADASNLCSQVKLSIPGARFAAVDFEDYPGMPLGSGIDTPYTLLTPGFISDCTAFSAAIGTMVADGGGDPPEAYNRTFFEAYSDAAYAATPALGGRDPFASQFLVVLGDATPHDATGFGSCASAAPDDFGRDAAPGGGDDLTTAGTLAGLVTNNITLLMIRYTTGGVSVALPCYVDMATATGGTAVDDSGAGTIGPFIIANAKLVPYTADLVVSAGCPIGFSFNPAFPTVPLTGPQVIPFVETITAPTVVGSYTCTITAVTTPGGPTNAIETVNLTVTAADPATLDLQPETATNTVDAQHCVTATVKDAFGNVTPGITVDFSVTPATFRTPPSGTAVTNASGVAQFCYTSALPGTDAISAFADTNGDSVQNGTEPGDTAAKTWVIPGTSTGCKVTYGGRITAANGDKATFGGNAKGTGPSGQEEYQDHGPAMDINVHSIDVQAVLCSDDGLSASIFGTATIDGLGSVDYRIDVTDLGEPGSSDTYRIRLSNGYDSGVQTLSGGNVQIHKAKTALAAPASAHLKTAAHPTKVAGAASPAKAAHATPASSPAAAPAADTRGKLHKAADRGQKPDKAVH